VKFLHSKAHRDTAHSCQVASQPGPAMVLLTEQPENQKEEAEVGWTAGSNGQKCLNCYIRRIRIRVTATRETSFFRSKGQILLLSARRELAPRSAPHAPAAGSKQPPSVASSWSPAPPALLSFIVLMMELDPRLYENVVRSFYTRCLLCPTVQLFCFP
jgi:hypothetical protein